MKRGLAIAGVVFLCLVLVTVSVLLGDGGEDGGARGKKGEAVYVELARLGTLGRDVSATGRLRPRESVELSAEVLGKVEAILVEEGDRVVTDQVLLRIDQGTLRETLDSTEAQVRLDRIAIDAAQLRSASARVDLERVEALHGRGILSDAQLQAARLAYDQGDVEVRAARERLGQADARLRALRADLAKTEVRAPLDATVLQVMQEIGEGVAPGMGGASGTPLLQLGDLSEMRVEVAIEEAEVALLALGQQASVEVDALPEASFQAQVVEVAVQGRTGKRGVVVFDAELRLLDPAPELRSGMSARTDIHVKKVEDRIIIPLAALVSAEDKSDFTFVESDGKVTRTEVVAGLSNDTHVVIEEGLAAGDRVVTGPYRTLKDLKDGAAVRAELENQGSDDDDSAGTAKGT